MSAGEALAALAARSEAALNAGSARAVERQHAKGKLTARERIDELFDPQTFVEVDRFRKSVPTGAGGEEHRPDGDGVVTGYGKVDGRLVYVYSQDFTVFGGSVGEALAAKVCKIMDMAVRSGAPIVGMNDSGGARIQEGVGSLAAFSDIGLRNVRYSGVVPQLSLIMGPCAGGAVYSPAVTDFISMVEGTAHMFVTGPEVVRAVTGEETTFEELGGAKVNGEAGNIHHIAENDAASIAWTRELLQFLPSNSAEDPPVFDAPLAEEVTDADRTLDGIVPDSANAAYDMRRILRVVLDDEDLFEIQPMYARSIICGLGRIEGRSVGVVANQPMQNAGVLDADASEKAARFVRTCDAYNIPILTFADVPGYLPGVEQERKGVIRRGSKLLWAYGEATVPRITVVTRKAYGGGYAAMGSKHFGTDLNLAWPSAEIAVMGAQATVEILGRKLMAEAAENGTVEETRRELMAFYRQTASPYVAAERGFIDTVIAPHETRVAIARALRLLRGKRVEVLPRKHGNIPL